MRTVDEGSKIRESKIASDEGDVALGLDTESGNRLDHRQGVRVSHTAGVL